MPRSAFIGSRRLVLKAAGLLPAALLLPGRASAAPLVSAEATLRAVEAGAAEVVARLRAFASQMSARAFAESLLRDQARHQKERDRVRRLLGLAAGPGPAATAPSDLLDLGALKQAQEKLTYALAEALPMLGRADAVRAIAGQMVDCSRHLTLLNLWIEAEERRAS